MLFTTKCYNCEENFDDEDELLRICYVCRKCFCISCNSRHKHEPIENNFEQLHDIIKAKTRTLYTPSENYDWNNVFEIARSGILDQMTWKCIAHLKGDFFVFHKRLLNIQMRFKYLLLKILLGRKFCNDIVEYIMRFV